MAWTDAAETEPAIAPGVVHRGTFALRRPPLAYALFSISFDGLLVTALIRRRRSGDAPPETGRGTT